MEGGRNAWPYPPRSSKVSLKRQPRSIRGEISDPQSSVSSQRTPASRRSFGLIHHTSWAKTLMISFSSPSRLTPKLEASSTSSLRHSPPQLKVWRLKRWWLSRRAWLEVVSVSEKVKKGSSGSEKLKVPSMLVAVSLMFQELLK